MLALKNIAGTHEEVEHTRDYVNVDPSLIFMPDITGFTRFVQHTEARHSRHIISELLEILIDSNHLGFEISELEGDAILFYKYEHVPSLKSILVQARQMFENFHNHLKQYNTPGICSCGATKIPVDLSLKIIIHQGKFEFTSVKQYRKPHGFDLILAHKLLKNSIDEKEYILVTDGFNDEISSIDSHGFSGEDFLIGKTNYKDIGEISYQYLSLKPLLDKIKKKGSDPPRCPMFVSR